MVRPWLAGLILVLAAGLGLQVAAQSPVTLDDILGMEALGPAALSPDGAWSVTTVRGAWDQAPAYRGTETTSHGLSRLIIRRTDGTGSPITLGGTGSDVGYASGPFSPDGQNLVITALSENRYRLGVMSLSTRRVQWFELSPEAPRLGQTVVWRSPSRLLVSVRPLDDLPVRMAVGSVVQDRLPDLWRRTADGAVGVTVAYSGARRDARAQLDGAGVVEIDIATGAVERLANGEVFDLAVSPDGGRVAVLREGRDLQIAADMPAVTGNPVRRRHLLILDRDRETVREPSPELDYGSHLLAWSRSGRELLAFARRDGEAFEAGRFYLIGDVGAEAIDLGADRPWIDRTDQGLPVPRGGFIDDRLWLQVRDQGGARLWRTETGEERLAVEEPRERLVEWGGQGWVVRSQGLWSLDGRSARPGRWLWADGFPDFSNREGVNGPSGRAASGLLLKPDGCADMADGPLCLDAEAVAVAGVDQGGVLLARYRSASGASRLTQTTRGRRVDLAIVNAALEDRDWGRLHEIAPAGGDADSGASSWLLVPSEADDGPPPLVVLMYPGATFSAAPGWLRPGSDRLQISAQALAAAGYAVLAPSLPVEGDRPLDGAGLATQLDAILTRVEDSGLADTGRAALVGHSFGGYGALLVASQSDRYRAVIANNGHTDLSRVHELPAPTRLMPESGPWYLLHAAWAETGQAALGASFVSAPERWTMHSPLYAVADLETPTLLVESDLDGARMASLFGALYRADREAKLVTYFGEGHVYASPGNIRDMHAQILDWLEHYVRPSQPFDPALPMVDPGLDRAPGQEAVAERVGDEDVQ